MTCSPPWAWCPVCTLLVPGTPAPISCWPPRTGASPCWPAARSNRPGPAQRAKSQTWISNGCPPVPLLLARCSTRSRSGTEPVRSGAAAGRLCAAILTIRSRTRPAGRRPADVILPPPASHNHTPTARACLTSSFRFPSLRGLPQACWPPCAVVPVDEPEVPRQPAQPTRARRLRIRGGRTTAPGPQTARPPGGPAATASITSAGTALSGGQPARTGTTNTVAALSSCSHL